MEMELKDKLVEFLRSYYYNELQEASKEKVGKLVIEFDNLDKFDPEISDKLLEDPDSVLPVFEEAVENIDLPNEDKINVRIINLPERQEIRARRLRARHIGKFITLDLTVKAASEVKPKIYEAVFKCPDCDNLITVPQKGKTLKSPAACDCGRRGRFELNEKKMMDIRWVSCNEPFEITEGEQPGQINVFLKEDLTTPKMQRKTDPGNRLKITGVLREIEKKKQGKMKTRLDMYLEANSVTSAEMEFDEIEITPEDEKKIKEIASSDDLFDKLKNSIAPGIYGYDEIKESIALQLFGGITKRMPDGTKTRGNIHILMTGDPGIGKSVAGSSMILHNSNDKPEFSSIAEFVDSQMETGKIINQGDTKIVINNDEDIKVASLNPDTYSLEWEPVSAFIRHTSPEKLLKVTTHSGRTITATKDHSFITMTPEGKIKPLEGKNLDKKKFLPVPLNTHKKMFDKVDVDQKLKTNALRLPDHIDLDWDFGFFLGLFLAEGSVSKGTLYISSKEEKNKQLVGNFLNQIGLNPNTDDRRLFANSRNFVKFLKKHCYKGKKERKGKGSGASRKSIPNFTFFAPREFIKGMLSGLFSGDGYYVNSRPTARNRTKGNLKLGLTTVSKTLSSGLMELLASLGIFNTIRRKIYTYKDQEKTCYEITVKGKHAKNFMKEIKLIGKKPKIQRVSSKDSHDVMPCVDLLYDIVKDLGYSKRLREDSKKRRAFAAMMRTVRNRKKLGRRRLQRIYEKLKKECLKKEKKETMKKLDKLKKILDSNVVWDQIKNIEEVSSNEDYVYDLSIDGNENFSVNNTLVHNSQLLKLASKAIPRGKYVSGKGVSGAGLTATVVKDEEMGGWVLEAGAIVLANKGIISIDEFDKMHQDDQVAMHEAMSIGTISIAKANIVATLPGETSVLAGANPKFGRFDPYKSIVEQIDIPETLLSRFDLKFALRDKPEEENDRRIAQHIINNMSDPKSAEPEIDRIMLRKYISYARKIEEMKISQEASKTLMDFYVDMRTKGSESETPVVAITFRQYEAMIRLAEAAARAQLKEKVEVEDAQRAIRLMKFSLRQLSTDPETGEFDIDVMESGTSSTQRSRINEIMDMIKELQADTGGEVYLEDLQAEAENRGLEKEKVDEVIEKLKQDGRIFSPKHGTIRIV